MSGVVRTEVRGPVLVVTIDHPPVNAGSAAVRQGLLQALARLSADAQLSAGVLIGAGNTFIAGSDLKEFGLPLEEPQLPTVIAAIEQCDKPVVAALHGAALGGGFELALGCDARVAAPGTVVGLPEVTLGMIPGAGGTQRLPRLVDLAEAIRLVCSGERIAAAQALALGLVDSVVEGNLLDAAISHALAMGGSKRRVRDLPVCGSSPDAIEHAAAAALKAGKQRPPVQAAIDAVRSAATMPIDAALAAERQVFQTLRVRPEAFALRHLFFAERQAGKLPSEDSAVARDVQTVAVIGAGTMGTGIAISALDAGLQVLLLERDADALARGQARLAAHDDAQLAKGRVSAAQVAARKARLQASLDWQDIARADAVIEAVFEDLAVKQSVFREIDRLARPGALLATNTSYLDVDAIASVTARAEDVIGLHFFSPAQVMRLLEVVHARRSSTSSVATGVQLARRLRKLPVVTGNAFGFIGNRIYAAYRRQCEFMLEDGAYPEQIDQALQRLGFAMGPFAVADLSGLDIAWRMRQAQAAQRDPTARYVRIADQLCEQGRFGRKSGQGYYRYESSNAPAQVDPAVHRLIEKASADKGIARRSLSDEEIQRRVMLTMVNEAAWLLTEGVTSSPADIDVVLANGYGFPRWEGGPVFWARQSGPEKVEVEMTWLSELSGPGFLKADLSPIYAGAVR